MEQFSQYQSASTSLPFEVYREQSGVNHLLYRVGIITCALVLLFVVMWIEQLGQGVSGHNDAKYLMANHDRESLSGQWQTIEIQKTGWPNLFGPEHNSVSSETGLNLDWPPEGPPVRWRVPIGEGYSSPIICEGRLIVMFRRLNQEVVSCRDAESGTMVWEFTYPTDFECGSHYSNGPYSTPATDGKYVYTLGAQGQFHCLEMSSGEVVWSCMTSDEYAVPEQTFGVGHSPLLLDKLVILNIGGESSSSGIVAFDKATGKIHWQSTDDGASFATPVHLTIHEKEWLFVLSDTRLVALNPQDGRVNWTIPYATRIDDAYNAVTPVVYRDLVFLSVYGRGAMCIQVQPDGSFRKVWEDNKTLSCQYNPIVCVDGLLYGVHATDHSLRCVDIKTGQLYWRLKSDLLRSTQIAVENRLILLGERGHLASIELGVQKPKVRSKTSSSIFDGQRCFSSPALSNGRLYLRDEHEIICMDLSREVEHSVVSLSE